MGKNRSIRWKLSVLASLSLVAVAGITLLAVRLAAESALRGTVRGYLISTVEQNAAQIECVPQRGADDEALYLPWDGAYLTIDLDYMDVVNDVYTALYTADGLMLYGENPLPRETGQVPFAEGRVRQIEAGGFRYELYDRHLQFGAGETELWIRGVVPETEGLRQLQQITRSLLMLLPLLIALAILAGWLLAGQMLAPLRRIEETAEQISRGDDLRRRIPEGESRDEIGRLARVFNGMIDRLERSFEAERRFNSDASHELRTPTSVILAQTEYSLEKERSPEEYVDALRVVRKQGRRMSALIDDMLAYTRMDQGPERYPFVRLDLSRLAAEAAEETRLLHAEYITLETEIKEGLFVEGNAMLLNRLTHNLLSNACRYGNGLVRVRLGREGKRICLSVEDNGPGIPPEEREKIFDRFYRSDASRSGEGTGLGLAMVKKIAQMHGAELRLESTPDAGSCFSVFFKDGTF